MKKLSILVPSTHTRYKTFNLSIQDQLYGQLDKLSPKEQEEVEIIILVDNKTIMLGEKRNLLNDIAQGKYVVHVDSDDRIAEDYISTLLKATEYNRDVITFTAMVSLNGNPPKPCYYSKDFKVDSNEAECYKRIPNHISCIKRDIAVKVDFPNILYGEDSGFSRSVLPYLKSEYKIDKVLYYYDYNEQTTETQKVIERKNTILRKNNRYLLDVVILSNAKTDRLRRMTERAIDSCISTTKGYPINIIVVEQNPYVFYKKVSTLHKSEDFNYNKFANLAIEKGEAEWIMVANNDVTFVKDWLDKLLSANSPVVSPRCRRDYRQKNINTNCTGYVNGVNFSGWCFMMKRYIWEEIGKFNEDFEFWFADNVVLEQLKKVDIVPMLVHNSFVNHLGSSTLKTESKDKIDDLTWGKVEAFNKKYGTSMFLDNENYIGYLKRKGS